MKINWGTSIVIAFVLFAAMLTYFMIKGARNQGDLVTEDYYQKEVVYQQRIHQLQNAADLGKITVQSVGQSLHLTFPEGLDSSAQGSVFFYKPDNAKIDFTIPVKLDKNLSQTIDVAQISRGIWILKVEVHLSDKSYYWEETVHL